MASLKQRLAAYEGASSSSSSLPSSSSSLKMQQEQSDASLADRISARERSVGSRNKKGASSAPSLKERMSAYQGAAARQEQEAHEQSQEFSLPPLPDHSTSSSSSAIKEPRLQDRTIMASFRPSKENSIQNRMSKEESSDSIVGTKHQKFIPKKKKLSSLEERMAKYVEVSSFPVALEMKINCPSEAVKAIESGSNTLHRHTSNNATATPPKSKEQQTGAVLQERMATYEEVISPRSQSNEYECAVVATKKKQRATVKPKRFKAKKAGGSDLRDRMAKYLQSSPDVPAEAIDEHHISPEEQRMEGDGKARMMSKHRVIRTTLGVPEMMDSVDSEHPTTEDDDNDPKSVSFVEEAPGASSTMQPAENETSSAPRKVGDCDSQPEKPGKTDPQCMKAGGDNSLGTEYYESSKSKEVPSDAGNEHPAVLKRSCTPKKLGGSDLQRRMAAFEEASSPKVFRKKETSVAEEEEHNPPKSEEAASSASDERPTVLTRIALKNMGGSDLQKRMAACEEATSSQTSQDYELTSEEHSSSKCEHMVSDTSDERPTVLKRIITPKKPGWSNLQKRMVAFQEATSSQTSQEIKLTLEEYSSSKCDQAVSDTSDERPTVLKRGITPRKPGQSNLQKRMAAFEEVTYSQTSEENELTSEKHSSSKCEQVVFDKSDEHPTVLKRSITPRKPGQSNLQKRMAAFAKASSPKDFQKKQMLIEDEGHSASKSVEATTNGSNTQPAVLKASLIKKQGGSNMHNKLSAFAKASSPEAFQKEQILPEEEHISSKIKQTTANAGNKQPAAPNRRLIPKKSGGSDLQKRTPAFAEASSIEASQKRQMSIDDEERSSSKVTSNASNRQPTVMQKSLTPKKPGRSDLQKRMSAFEEIASPKTFQKKQIMMKDHVLSKQSGGCDLQKRMAMFDKSSSEVASYKEEVLSPEPLQKKKPVIDEHAETYHNVTPQSKKSASEQRMLAARLTFQKKMAEEQDISVHTASEPGISDQQERVINFEDSSLHQATKRVSPDNHNTLASEDTDSLAGSDQKERVVRFNGSSSHQVSQGKKAGTTHNTANQAGRDLKQRMTAFEEVSSPEAFHHKKPRASNRSSIQSISGLKEKMANFKEMSSPEVFQKKKVDEHATSKRLSIQAISGLQEKLANFKGVSSPEVFQKKKLGDHEKSYNEVPQLGNDLKQRMVAFKEASSPEAFQKKKPQGYPSSQHMADKSGSNLQQGMSASTEVSSNEAFERKKLNLERCLSVPRPTETALLTHRPSFNPQDGKCSNEVGKPYMGRVVENRRNSMREGPKDFEYLYGLAVNLNQLKSQGHNSPHFSAILAEEDDTEGCRYGEGGDIKASLERIMGSRTHYAASGNWLNEEWIKQHLIRDDNFRSLKFQFRDPTLFKQFDKTVQTSRDVIIHRFVKQLLLHANDITQLDLSSCLLPDIFVEVLAKEVLKNPDGSFPKLQLLNFESNVLQGPGIEALSDIIVNKTAWKYLQALLLENQKHSLTNEAERALADAQKDINDAILLNVDNLRLARRDHQAKTGTLKERKRNDMELYFDGIAGNKCKDIEVELVGDQTFVILEDTEKTRAGAAFATNTSVKSVKMELLGLDDSFAKAFGEAIATNKTIEKVNIDSNSITGIGMRALLSGLGRNQSIVDFQVRHQKKAMATLDEEVLPDLLMSNSALLKLGVDVRSKLVKMRLDEIINANRDRLRKLRADAKIELQ